VDQAVKYDSMSARLLANSNGPAEDQNENGCWLWARQLQNTGYGVLAVHRTGKSPAKRYAHRVMAQTVRDLDAQLAADDALPGLLCAGPVTARPLHPDHETIDHLCRKHSCVNPDHQVLLTRAENSRMRWGMRWRTGG
jgi:hypothetical protein